MLHIRNGWVGLGRPMAGAMFLVLGLPAWVPLLGNGDLSEKLFWSGFACLFTSLGLWIGWRGLRAYTRLLEFDDDALYITRFGRKGYSYAEITGVFFNDYHLKLRRMPAVDERKMQLHFADGRESDVTLTSELQEYNVRRALAPRLPLLRHESSAARANDEPRDGLTIDQAVEVSRLSDYIAYTLLPEILFKGDWPPDVLVQFLGHMQLGELLYQSYCEQHEAPAKPEIARRFVTWQGMLSAEWDFTIIEFPKHTLSLDQSGTLAPHYCCIVKTWRPASPRNLFVLGRSPLADSTTFREITRTGLNANLGPGPDPTPELFLAHVRKHIGE